MSTEAHLRTPFVKTPAGSRLLSIEFADDIPSGEALAAGTAAVTATEGDSVLTIADVAVSGTTVQFRLSAGTAGEDYCLRITVDTNSVPANTLDALLEVHIRNTCP